MRTWIVTALFLSYPLTAAEPVSPEKLKKLIEDLKSSNAAINKESSLVEKRCANQKDRADQIDEALRGFDGRIKELQDKIKQAQDLRKPFKDVLDAAKLKLDLSVAEIASINVKLATLGRPDQQMAALLKSKAEKSKLKKDTIAMREAGQLAFNKWEDLGDNARILDEALDLMAKGTEFEKLSPIQQEAVKVHKAFRVKDEELFDLIHTLNASLDKIEKDLKDLADKKAEDKKSLEDRLKAEIKKRDDAKADIAKNAPEVAKYDQLIANYQGSINQISGLHRVDVSQYCSKLAVH